MAVARFSVVRRRAGHGGGDGARRTPGRHRLAALVAVLAVVAGTQFALAPAASAQGYVPIAGAGSTWSANAIDQWRRNVATLLGISVNYAATGSSAGRNDFKNGTVDFAVSEIEYGLSDGGVIDTPPTDRAFGYMPIVAGGTAFMYNLKIGNTRVTNLRLSGDVLARIFTQEITNWSDPAIKADNPGLTLPARPIVPVVRSDGSGTTAQFTRWLAARHAGIWDAYCAKAGRTVTPCGFTSFYPLAPGMESKPGSTAVSAFVKQESSEGAITYVEYAYARNVGFPVAKVLNEAGYYVAPTASNVAVALLKAGIRSDLTQNLSGVYTDGDKRTYPLSSYSYLILPKSTNQNFTNDKGRTLSDFAYYFLCEGQQQAEVLGYAPLPVNLVQAGVDQVAQIPGTTNKLNRNNLQGCNNPTFSPDGTDRLAKEAPQPPECDRKGGPAQCGTGNGGAMPPMLPRPASTITLTTSPASPVAPDTAVTLTATVTPSNAAGSVQFADGTTTIGNPVSVTNGTASTTTTFTPGTHSLTVVFTPTDPTAATAATSNTLTFVVSAPTGAKATTTTLRVVPHRAFEGVPVVVLATVAPRGATGTVQFQDGTTALGAPVPVTGGFALLSTSLPRGTHSLTAVFTPTDPAAFAPATSSPVSLTVNPLFWWMAGIPI